MHNANEIRSTPCPECKICGSRGIPTYKGLPDRLFSAPGLWNLSKCSNSECGLMWLDPMPLEEDMHKAYRSYYTHGDEVANDHFSGQFSTDLLTSLFRKFLKITPVHRERMEHDLMYTGNLKGGKLLEVGCGNGTRLSKIAALGWYVEGQEVDPVSANVASRKGMKIHVGYLDKLGLKDESFDAIVMNHVIEHVHDPVEHLSECRRLLKPNGTIIVVTPNSRSLGHRLFKSNWRGLEPPRHVMVHSLNSIRRAAFIAGFYEQGTWTTMVNANNIAFFSLEFCLKKKAIIRLIKPFNMFASLIFMFLERMILMYDATAGEDIVLLMRKKN